MGSMDTKAPSIPFITIEEESGSDLSNGDLETEQSRDRKQNHDNKKLPTTPEKDDDTDGVQRSHSYNMAMGQGETSPLLKPSSTKKGRFTVSKSPDISKGDFYSANIESFFQNMEPVSRKPKPNLKVDIEKANRLPHEKVSFDMESAKEPLRNDPLHGDATLSVVNELDLPFHASHQRRPSKLFTVINYGNVSTEHIPASPAVSARQDIERLSWPNRGSVMHSSHPQIRDLFNSQAKLYASERRRSSLLSTSKFGQIKPRVRLVSGTHSYNVNDKEADDILSLNSYNTAGSHPQIYHKSHLSITDITSKPDILPQRSEGKDKTDNKYAVETVRGSVGQMSKTLLDVAKRGRLFAKRKTRRLILKDGTPNITLKNIKTKHKKFMLDIFTTVLDMQWRWVLFLFCLAFIFSWLAFAAVWLLIGYVNGDLDGSSENKCVDNVDGFFAALLFSIETQHTIGYGTRAMTTYCPASLGFFMLQSIFGVIVQCVMAGIIFAKLAKPKHRAETIMFSKKAVVCKRDGEYCLVFRVADMRSSQLIGATLHAMFVKKKVTEEGEAIPFHQHHMEIKTESEDHDQFIFLAWPIRIVHHIDENSPLWNISAEQLLTEDFEIIVVLEGCIESSGMTTQIRTSYLPCEVLWGQTLSSMQTSRNEFGKNEINYSNFDETLPGDLPECSAKEYYEKYQNSVW